MEDNDCCDADKLITQTADLHCFDEPLELETCEVEAEGRNQVQTVAKILSIKHHSVNFVKSVLAQIWSIPKGLKIAELEHNKFSIIFPSVQEKKRILEKGPWAINRALLILKDVPPYLAIREVNFSTVLFWIRIIGLPREAISKANLCLISSRIGRMVEIDKKSLGVFFAGDYVRVKVEIRVHQLLAAGFFQKRKRGVPRWIQIKYERLQDFCFKYGILGHDYRICTAAEGVTVTNGITRVALYGPWLRAESEIVSCFQSNRSEIVSKLNDQSASDASDAGQTIVSRNRNIGPERRMVQTGLRLKDRTVTAHAGLGQIVQTEFSGGCVKMKQIIPSSSYATEGDLESQARSYSNEETMVKEVQMFEESETGPCFTDFCRAKRGKDAKYAGLFPDVS